MTFIKSFSTLLERVLSKKLFSQNFTINRLWHKIEYLFKGQRIKLKIAVAKLDIIVHDNKLFKN